MPKIINGFTEDAINTACRQLKNGNIVALPTETVYGLAADACNEEAVKKIFKAKKRPLINPLICHVHPSFDLSAYVEVSPMAQQFIDAFWPGPLSLVLPLAPHHNIAPSVTAGLSTLALRAPRHDVFQNILKKLQTPLAAPSANKSKGLSPTEAQHVLASLCDSDITILDGGAAIIGLESTIIDLCIPQKPLLLRQGVITKEEIQNKLSVELGESLTPNKEGKVNSPGQLLQHYAPKTSLRLHITKPLPDEVWLSFGASNYSHHLEFNLSPNGHLEEAAANLFSFLWKADQLHVKSIAIAPIPHEGIGMAINDRLKRAAAK